MGSVSTSAHGPVTEQQRGAEQPSDDGPQTDSATTAPTTTSPATASQGLGHGDIISVAAHGDNVPATESPASGGV